MLGTVAKGDSYYAGKYTRLLESDEKLIKG